jgi:septal ring factor EnvC (AmiA/AmiB activator)
MKVVNLIGRLQDTSKRLSVPLGGKSMDKFLTAVGGIKNVVIIAVLVFAAYQVFTIGGSLQKTLKEQYNYQLKQQQTLMKLNQTLDTLNTKSQELNKKLEESQAQVEALRMDTGKAIRDFNRKVKELKDVTDPKESYRNLERAWSAGSD